MFTTITTLFIVLGLMIGGGTATAYAAQGSLPGEALYGIKMASEDARLGLTGEPLQRIHLDLEFAARRVLELKELKAQGEPADVQALNRLQNQVEAALKEAANLPPDAAASILAEIQLRLQEQERIMAQINTEHPEDALVLQARQQLQQQLRLAAEGQQNQHMLQEQLRLRASQQQMIKQQNQYQVGQPDCGEDCEPEPETQLLDPASQEDPGVNAKHLMTRNRYMYKECIGDCDPDPQQDRDQDRDGGGTPATGGSGEQGGNPATGGGDTGGGDTGGGDDPGGGDTGGGDDPGGGDNGGGSDPGGGSNPGGGSDPGGGGGGSDPGGGGGGGGNGG